MLKPCRLLVALLFFFVTLSTSAQPMPKEDVIDVPAVGEGLWPSNLFQSNMVVQRDRPIPVWGWADPGEKVTVSFAGNSASATADKNRAWRVELPALPANSTPQSMTITGKSKTITLENILVGDVWLLGGQSNMEMEISDVENGGLEVASANYPNLRLLTIPQGELPDETPGFARLYEYSNYFKRHFRKGDWDVCSPKTVTDFSAIGYIFARRLQKAADIPIGVIDMSRGGTCVESWTPLQTLREMDKPEIKKVLADWDNKAAEFDAQKDLEQRIEAKKQRIARMEKEGQQITDEDRELPSDLRPGPLADMNHPGANYQGMLKPIAGLPVKGAIWHQGYNNAMGGLNGPGMYREVFPVMIASWREAFKDPAMPFCVISLCTDTAPQTLDNYSEMMHNLGMEIREAQYKTFRDLYDGGDKNIGFASSYDLRRAWYHPQVKIPAGERAARWALATQYGFSERQIPWKPPVLKDMKTQDASIILNFDQEVGDQNNGDMLGFAIAGNDRRFHPAKAEYLQTGVDSKNQPQYDKKKIKLTSIMVPEPVAYRYAWGRNPLANVQAQGNKDLPLPTQRSDDWPMHAIPLGILPEDVTLPLQRADRNKLLIALREQDKQRRLEQAKALIEELSR